MAGSEAPPFWFRKKGWAAYSLAPLSWIYGAAARWRMDNAKPFEVMAPVMCIGNLTVGGSGKTPTAIAIARAAREEGYTPGFLTRGYGGSHPGPHLVDPEHDTASAVGDEPLLLARIAPTIVARNRAAGAKKLLEHGVDFIVMDDGFQSRKVYFDYALIALDARRGPRQLARSFPPVRCGAPVIDQMRHADALLRIGDGAGGVAVVRAAARAAKPVLRADLVPHKLDGLEGAQLLAFSGIGDPSKFFETLETAGLHDRVAPLLWRSSRLHRCRGRGTDRPRQNRKPGSGDDGKGCGSPQPAERSDCGIAGNDPGAAGRSRLREPGGAEGPDRRCRQALSQAPDQPSGGQPRSMNSSSRFSDVSAST